VAVGKPEHIYSFLTRPDLDRSSRWLDGASWYFCDVEGDFHGPFSSYEEVHALRTRHLELYGPDDSEIEDYTCFES